MIFFCPCTTLKKVTYDFHLQKKKNLNMTVGIVDRRHFVCAKVSNFYGSQDTIHSTVV